MAKGSVLCHQKGGGREGQIKFHSLGNFWISEKLVPTVTSHDLLSVSPRCASYTGRPT